MKSTQTPLPEWIVEGARFRLIHMPDDPDPVPDGSTGTIVGIVSLACIGEADYQLWVDWDCDRSLMLSWPHDQIEPLEENAHG